MTIIMIILWVNLTINSILNYFPKIYGTCHSHCLTYLRSHHTRQSSQSLRPWVPLWMEGGTQLYLCITNMQTPTHTLLILGKCCYLKPNGIFHIFSHSRSHSRSTLFVCHDGGAPGIQLLTWVVKKLSFSKLCVYKQCSQCSCSCLETLVILWAKFHVVSSLPSVLKIAILMRALITLLHKGLTHIQSQIKPWLLFGKSFTLMFTVSSWQKHYFDMRTICCFLHRAFLLVTAFQQN